MASRHLLFTTPCMLFVLRIIVFEPSTAFQFRLLRKRTYQEAFNRPFSKEPSRGLGLPTCCIRLYRLQNRELLLQDEENQQGDDFMARMQPGIPEGYFIVKKYNATLQDGFAFDYQNHVSAKDANRLDLSPFNVTLPLALMILDPSEYPSQSRARKACRKGTILILRGESGERIRGRVGDHVLVGDVVAQQVRMGSGQNLCLTKLPQEPPLFDMPVVYQDDHFAIVNKPAGVASRERGALSVRAALPFALEPPRRGTFSVMKRPQPVHRLDKPTSGLLLIAKTKPAMVNLSRQFLERKIQKTYTAIVNGIPEEPIESRISSRQAFEMGVDVDPNNETPWQVMDYSLDDKEAITVWRVLGYYSSLKANDETLTIVELKPKTGRYHQLRRHFAWALDKPFVGDADYDPSSSFRQRGLFLCSNQLVLEHPYYNTEEGRTEWNKLCNDDEMHPNGMLEFRDGKVMVHASIELPHKFQSLLTREHERALKFASETFETQPKR